MARPQASEASVKSAIPIRNSRRWPKRSPSRPPSSRKPPNVSRYAFTTQASDVSEKPRSSRIDGQRDVHDRRVEDDHQVAEAEDDQREPAGAGVGDGHRSCSFRSAVDLEGFDGRATRNSSVARTDEFPRRGRSKRRWPRQSRACSSFAIRGPIARADLPGPLRPRLRAARRERRRRRPLRRARRRARRRDGRRARAAPARRAAPRLQRAAARTRRASCSSSSPSWACADVLPGER